MKRIAYIVISLPFFAFIFLSCGLFGDDSSSPSGSYSGSGSIIFNARVRVVRSNTSIEATIYNREDEAQAVFSWAKFDEIPERLDDISAGRGKKLIISTKTSENLIEFRGESEEFNLKDGKTVDLGDINLESFSPKILTPTKKAISNGNSINFEWEPVEGAVNYRIIVHSINEIISATEYHISSFSDLVDPGENQLNLTVDINSAQPFPDTGQTVYYKDADDNEPFGQDADYLTGEPDYTNFYANGRLFIQFRPAPKGYNWEVSAITAEGEEGVESRSNFDLIWGMAKDDITGLVWEIKTTDGSIHDSDNLYSWDMVQNDITELNETNFGGISSWRLPTIEELLTIVHSGKRRIAFNDRTFWNCPTSEFWTSSSCAKDPNHFWTVDFSDGRIYKRLVDELVTEDSPQYLNIRAVAGTFPVIENPEDRFTDNDDGTITDLSTGLIWQKASIETATWTTALDYCEDLVLSSEDDDDWRLPNKNELLSIVDYKSTSQSVAYLPDTEPSEYWSSTTYLGNQYVTNAWAVDFSNGMPVSIDKKPDDDKTYYVKAVRGGKIYSRKER